MIPRDLLKAPFEVVQAYLNAACEFIVSQPNYVPSVEPIEITPEADAKARETIGKKFSGQNPGESRGFCPTGQGGGIDNSCGKEGGGGRTEGYDSPLSTPAARAIDNWITDYADINEALRDGDDHPDAEGLSEAISKATPFKEDTVLYRGLSVEDGSPVALTIENGGVGATIYDDGFSATTEDPDVANRFATEGDTGNKQYVLRIKAPKGTRAAPIKSGLKERVLDAGTGVRITGIERSGEVTFVDAEIT